MGFLDRFKGMLGSRQASEFRELDPLDDELYEPFVPNTTSGAKVSADSAILVSAVFRCIIILSDTLATLPVQMYRLRGAGKKGMDEAPEHPLDDILRVAPNNWQTPAEFWGMMGFHAALRGVAYAEIKPGPRGAVDQLIPHHPDLVCMEILRDRSLRFRVTDQFTGQTKVLLQEEMLRIPGLTLDGVTAMRTVGLAAETIGLLMSADQYAARVFSNKLNIGGFLSHPGKMSEDAKKRLVTKLMQRFAGFGNAHRPLILSEGMKFERAAMDAKDAQLLEARKWQVGEVARFWGIPLHMLGIDDQTNRSTVEEQSLNFVRFTVRPWVTKVEQAILRDLILAKRLYRAAFDLDELERGNMAARAEYLSKALGAGGSPPWLTQNEARQMEGWNPVDDPSADRLAIATNPGTPEPGAQPAREAPPADEEAGQVEDLTPEARAARLASKENAAVRKGVLRHAGDPDAMRTWIRAFYGGHVSTVETILGVPREVAKAYCAFQRDEAIAANDIAGLIDRRDDNLAATIAETLRRHGDQNG